MWSFIKFRQLVKSQETIVILKKNKIYLLSKFSLYSLLLNWLAPGRALPFHRRWVGGGGRDDAPGDLGDRRGLPLMSHAVHRQQYITEEIL